MKVKDLIKELNKLDPNLQVVIEDGFSMICSHISDVYKDDDLEVVCLQSGDEFDEDGE